MVSVEEFTQYTRISDILLYFTEDITFRFVTNLSKSMRSGERRFFMYEVENGGMTRDGLPTRSITRNMWFYFVIDIKSNFDGGFVIAVEDVLLLSKLIENKVLPWFSMNSGQYAFQYIKDKDILTITEFKPVLYTKSEIKYLKFEPCITKDRNEKVSAGVSININNCAVVNITLEKFMAFKYFLGTDMYTAACELINFVKTEPYGINVFRPQGLGSGRADDRIQAQYSSIEVNRR